MRTIQSLVRVAAVIGLVGVMGSCARGQWPGTAFVPPTEGPDGFVECAETTNSAQRDIGPAGDSVVLQASGSSRKHVLTVPTNAVPSGMTRFTLRNIGDDYVGVSATANPDRVFNPAVKLRLSYAGCSGAGSVGSLQMYRWEQVGAAQWDWVKIGGNHNATEQWVEVDRADLSEYALGST